MEMKTEKRISILKISIIIFAAYHLNMMACSIYTDSLIGWSGTLYYIVSMGSDEYVPPRSDMFLSLDGLQAVYGEVRRVVREY